jgi:Uma2 family endonuclease
MAADPKTGRIGFAEFLERVRQDQKADLIDGVINMPSPEYLHHNDLGTWLTSVIRPFVEVRRLGTVVASRVAFRLADRTSPEPDVAVVRSERAHQIRAGYVDGAPDLVIEIVSPESAERDYDDKRRVYERAGVGEYWVIDPGGAAGDVPAAGRRPLRRGRQAGARLRKHGAAGAADRRALVVAAAAAGHVRDRARTPRSMASSWRIHHA